MPAFIRITKDFLQRGASPYGGWTREQLHELGVDWPLKKGWKETILGSLITVETADKFLAANNPKEKYQRFESPQEAARLLCARMRSMDEKQQIPSELWNKFYQEIKFYLGIFMNGAVKR